MTKTALMIGATGGVGREVARALVRRGWHLRCLSRTPNPVSASLPGNGVAWINGDAMKADDVVNAARDVALIVHAANPPRYKNWRGLAMPMLRNSIEAARASSARLIFPGNLYNFGADAGPLLSETTLQQPNTRKGRVRSEMEDMLRAAAATGTRSLVVRAGDVFGGHGPSSNFSNVLIKPRQSLRAILYPGPPATGHAWAYLPDYAEAIARLAEIEADLPSFDVFHFGGHWIEPGIELAQSIRRAAGRLDLPIRRFPWLAVRLLAPFVPLLREVEEVRYLWDVPLRLDNSKLIALIGDEPHTPLDQAVRASLLELGCLSS
ncbi:NAD-dependent epimerase/dehydratase family protein [Bradyrhizobium altum]|uniref:NAD-dependent epimerase/dehydratase family protein n=1 Tax=Bradyrhizobium altum TaxID=1571202 RepID=UPI001E55E314|nr:NAD-dependent epimerase/dehydratase family protein [Bradyrhizobium altum]